ncbi:MAG: hypothetical protein NTY36_05170 [Deltaproteobacteria bacterium]|nr:hypothetical protein [Deltaproteobacteria bacterium]
MTKVLLTVLITMGLYGIAFGQGSLDLSSDSVPKGFKGDNIVAAVEALNKVVYTRAERGPGKRVDLADKKDIDKIYVFKLDDDKVLSSSNGIWIEKSTEGIAPRYIGPPEVYYLVQDMGKKSKGWTGQNVFGAKVRAETTTEKRYFVTPINGTENIKKLAVKPEGGKIGVLFIGKPAKHRNATDLDPGGGNPTPGRAGLPARPIPGRTNVNIPEGYISYCGQSYAATFDMPYGTSRKFYSVRMELQEVWAYDQESGKVLLKQKIEKLAEPEPTKTIRPRPVGPPPLRPPTPRT